jgi:xylulokinase
MRAKKQVDRFIEKTGIDDWYLKTGASIPGPSAVFKIMWYMDNEPEMLKKAYKILGTKDFINLKLTGRFLTDNSYASGSGVYDLDKNQYSPELIKISEIDEKYLPEIVSSTLIIGELTEGSAKEIGLPRKVKVACGGGDTSCMALGAKGIKDGRVYTNVGSCAWIAVTSVHPILNLKCYPNVFAHVIPGMYNSAVTIFSAGSAFRWVRDVICSDLVETGKRKGIDPYELMTEMAGKSPAGANKLIFYPALAMGSHMDSSVNTKGAFTGLDLRHTRDDILRAAMEGITLNLGWYLDELKKQYKISEEMLIVGGGSNSSLWRQIFADIYNMDIVKTNVGQSAGALGAAGIAAVGAGIWSNFEVIDSLHKVADITKPIPENRDKYKRIMTVFKHIAECQASIGDRLQGLQI